jgi:non-specific serine/threonine protein kinase
MDSRLGHRAGPSHNLPARLSSFVGREREIAEVVRLLAGARLVTLVGAPGVGKTRLALRVAGNLTAEFVDGVWLVELAALAEPALVPQAMATTLGVREQPGRPLATTLAEALSQRALLLVLDNCEHLVAACATLVEDLLHACPDLRVLVTSREALRVEGEVTWRVPSLSMPDSEQGRYGGPEVLSELAGYEAVRLFVDRAQAARSTFALSRASAGAVAQLCRRLDGIPLAIELAAARVRGLSVEQVAARLDDRFALLTGGSRTALPRHQTLRAAVDWSYDLLADPERALLRRLAVFAGGWTLEAAEAVCAFAAGDGGRGMGDGDELPSPSPPEVLDLLLQLVDKSLVQVDAAGGAEPRYRMLEMIWQYGLEQLRAAGEEAAIRRRHLEWCLALAEEIEVWGADGATWIERLAVEHDNVRAALSWSLADTTRESAEAGLRLAVAAQNFWFVRDYLIEGRQWMEQVLAAEQERGRDGDRADSSTGGTAGEASQPVRSRDALGAHPRVAALNALASLEYQQQAYGAAVAHAKEALALARSFRDDTGAGHALVTLGTLARARGEYDRSAALLEESVALFRTVGDAFGLWRAPNQLGETLAMLGDLERARQLHEASLAVARSMDWSWRVAHVLRNVGLVAYRRDDLERGAALLEESVMRWRVVQATRGPHWALAELGHIAIARGDSERAATCFAESLVLNREAGDRRGVARCPEGLAAAQPGRGPAAGQRRAARLLGAAAALREAIGIPVSPLERPTFERAGAVARSAGEAAYVTAWAEGRALSVDQALALALEQTATLPAAPAEAPAAPLAHRSATGPDRPLTAREREVAAQVARGLTNRQIAADLVISERTVDGHVASILAKLGFSTRAQVAVWAARRGLAGPDEG